MKSKLFLLATAALMCGSVAFAQQQRTVSGTVTDSKGAPIPGARVELVGCNESVLTELDGTFVFNTECAAKDVLVQYGGMQAKKQSIKTDMLIKLHKSSWWSDQPTRYRWFVTAQVAFPWEGAKDPAFGAMIGVVKDWGVYVKGVFHSLPSTDGEIRHLYADNQYNDEWLTGESKIGYYSISGGIIKRLWCPIHLYLGGGFAKRKQAIEVAGEGMMEYLPTSLSSGIMDAGLMMNIKWFTIAGGISTSFGSGNRIVGNVGIGVNF